MLNACVAYLVRAICDFFTLFLAIFFPRGSGNAENLSNVERMNKMSQSNCRNCPKLWRIRIEIIVGRDRDRSWSSFDPRLSVMDDVITLAWSNKGAPAQRSAPFCRYNHK